MSPGELYSATKTVHVATVTVTIAFFTVRGLWMLRESPLLGRRWVRIVPHVNDSLLLTTGIGLAYLTGQAPGSHPWLTAKLAGLLAYIGLGMVALRRGRTRALRVGAFAAALAVAAYLVSVALTRQALPWA